MSNRLRVVHYPKMPCNPFYYEVADVIQAYVVKDALAEQSLFLEKEGIVTDYSNAIYVQEANGFGGWVDYYNEEHDMDFDEYCVYLGAQGLKELISKNPTTVQDIVDAHPEDFENFGSDLH